MDRFKIGDRAFYRGAWGTEAPQLVTVTGMGFKNGQRVYDTNTGRWGYADQFEAIVDLAPGEWERIDV